ncbi:hypothetical protein I7I53_01639 [Histoplasma capsulatum var. duboisii H88]|uniref:Uncharacterized protein n=1 Tax=Ajellomyces capsulatus (strain H88) TaxID=544711 RepID=A0A8A1LM75_AJEC8|nr:hypothetical protein I7I53_01639 [Histoplasma capsulatum var. duboisii H88]
MGIVRRERGVLLLEKNIPYSQNLCDCNGMGKTEFTGLVFVYMCINKSSPVLPLLTEKKRKK